MNITELQRRLVEAPDLDAVMREAGVSPKTIQRLKAGVTGTVANFLSVEAALDKLSPRQAKRRREKAVACDRRRHQEPIARASLKRASDTHGA